MTKPFICQRSFKAKLCIFIAILFILIPLSTFQTNRDEGSPHRKSPSSNRYKSSKTAYQPLSIRVEPGPSKPQLPAGVKLSLDEAKCRGDVNRQRMHSKGLNKPAGSSVEGLDGWIEADWADPLSEDLIGPYHSLFPHSTARQFEAQADQTKKYHDAKNILRNPTKGYYQSVLVPANGLIVSVQSESPLHNIKTEDHFKDLRQGLNGDQLAALLPKTSSWSEIVWIQWVAACRKVNTSPRNLQYVIRDNILTSDTQYIMEQVIHVGLEHLSLQLPWPGRDFLPYQEGFRALLGTVHASGIVRLLHDHRHEIPAKTIQKIRLWTVEDRYFMGFSIG